MRPLVLALAAAAFASCSHHPRHESWGDAMKEKYDPRISANESMHADEAYDEAIREAERIDGGYYVRYFADVTCPPSASPGWADTDAAEKRKRQVDCRRRAELVDAGVL